MIAATALAAPAPETLVEQYLDILRRDDRGAIESLRTRGAGGANIANIREFLDNSDCVTIHRASWSIESMSENLLVVWLDADVTATTKAAWSPMVRMPRFTRLEAMLEDGKWKLHRAEFGEHTIGRAMLESATPEDARCILQLAPSHLDPARIVFEYADMACDQSDAHAQFAVDLAAAMHDPSLEVFARRMLAYRWFFRAPRGVELAREAVALAEAHGNLDDIATSYFSLGAAHYLAREYRQSSAMYAKAASFTERIEEPLIGIKSMHMHGHAASFYGDVRTQLRATERVTEWARRYRWPEGEEVSSHIRGEIQFYLGNLDASRAAFDEAIALARARNDLQFFGASLMSRGMIEAADGNLDGAIALFRRAIDEKLVTDAWELNVRTELVRAHLRKKDYAAAEALVNDTDPVRYYINDPQSIEAKGDLYLLRAQLRLAQKRPDDALAELRTGRKYIEGEAGMAGDQLAASHTQAGAAYFMLGREADAITEFRAAIARLESRRSDFSDELSRVHYLKERLQPYVSLAEILVARGEVEEAFRISELMKGRGLRDAIARGRVDVSVSMTKEEREKEEALEDRIVELNRKLREQVTPELQQQLARARTDRDGFVSAMRVKYPAVQRRRVEEHAELALPDPKLTVVSYVVGETQTLAFIVRNDANGRAKVDAVRIPVARETLEADANELARLVSSRSQAWQPAAKQLHRLLVAPLEPWTRSATELCIIPDRALWTVPFQALVASDGKPLVERHAVFYAHSLALLRNATAHRQDATSQLLAFGNPYVGEGTRAALRSAYRTFELGPLPDAEDEVRALASLYPNEARVLTNRAARESVFKKDAERYDIIHLAAHAIVDARSPMYSAIVLANAGDDEDGLLEAREVADLPLNGRLVVLSACETARGSVGAGEGVLGMAWAFFAAGCPTTVASQWKAESRATAQLMVEMHRRLAAGDSTAEALRRAQLRVRRNSRYSHPFYWAPFVALGAATQTPR